MKLFRSHNKLAIALVVALPLSGCITTSAITDAKVMDSWETAATVSVGNVVRTHKDVINIFPTSGDYSPENAFGFDIHFRLATPTRTELGLRYGANSTAGAFVKQSLFQNNSWAFALYGFYEFGAFMQQLGGGPLASYTVDDDWTFSLLPRASVGLASEYGDSVFIFSMNTRVQYGMIFTELGFARIPDPDNSFAVKTLPTFQLGFDRKF